MAIRDSGETHGAAWQLPHAEGRWADRAGPGAGNLLARWREAVPVDAPQADEPGKDVRYHPAADVLLVASFGAIVTAIPLSDRPRTEQRYIRRQA